MYATSRAPLLDIDLYWHLVAGREITDGTPLSDVGSTWSFSAAAAEAEWTSTQWLSEVGMYWFHHVGGWTSMVALRVVSAAAAMAILAWNTLRGRPKALAGIPFLLACMALAATSQERPQQITLMGSAVLGGVLLSGLQGTSLPRWYVILPWTLLWANMHGGWILVPAVAALVSIARLIDFGFKDDFARRAFGLAVLGFVGGSISPSALGGTTAVDRFRDAAYAAGIREWQPVQPVKGLGILTLLMLLVILIAWARSGRPSVGEVVAVFATFIFAWSAWRNLAPSLTILAPLAASRLVTAFPRIGRSEPKWSASAGIGLAMFLTVLSVAGLPGREHLPLSSRPVELAKQIGKMEPGQRVLNDYNSSGLVLYFGRQSAKVGIDGRSDLYGADYINWYKEIMQLAPGWEERFAELDPTAALLPTDAPLTWVLREVRDWQVVGQESGFTLLVTSGKAT